MRSNISAFTRGLAVRVTCTATGTRLSLALEAYPIPSSAETGSSDRRKWRCSPTGGLALLVVLNTLAPAERFRGSYVGVIGRPHATLATTCIVSLSPTA